MFDKISWEVFKKTGDIDAYLLYIDLKNLDSIKDIDTRSDNNNSSPGSI